MNIKNKGGRKPKPIKRIKQVSLKFYRHEHFRLSAIARQHGFKLAVMLREMVLKKEVKSITISDEDRRIMLSLIKFGNNINVLAKKCHQQNMTEILVELKSVLNPINQVINNIQNL